MEQRTGTRNWGAEELYRKYWPMVLKRCRDMLGDAQSAADAAQEVFVKILDKRETLRVEYPSSFLWRTATNHCLDALRERSRRAEAACGDAFLAKIASSLDVEGEAASRDLLRKLFDRCTVNNRAIAVLHFADGMTIKETARVMNISVDTVNRGLRALRKTLKKLEWTTK